MKEDIAIKVTGLSKRYEIGKSKDSSLRGTLSGVFKSAKSAKDEFWALKDVNFEVKKGDVVGIIGKNGAGKSTLLKVLSQITKPTEGRIEINGRVASLLEVGTGFHPELTGRENIYLNGTILGMSRKEVSQKFDEIVEFSGVQKFIDTPVKHYSSGMYVRLAFAVAAHLEPEILIIDEVLAVGDAEFQKKCLGKMKDVAGEGRTVLFVSHDLGAVQKICSKGFVLDHGKISFKGTSTDCVNTYISKTKNNSITNRKSNKQLYFSDAFLSGEDGQPKSKFNFNEKISLNLNLTCNEAPKRSIQICVALLNGFNQRMFSVIETIPENKIKDTMNLHFQFDEDLIVPNQYSFLIQVYIPPGNIIFDELESVLNFEIVDNGSKLMGYKDYGFYIPKYTFLTKSNQ